MSTLVCCRTIAACENEDVGTAGLCWVQLAFRERSTAATTDTVVAAAAAAAATRLRL